MATPMLLRKSVAGFAIETFVGVAETLVAADGAINVYNLKITPDIETTEREGQGGFSKLSSVRGALGGTCTFTTELISGTADPFWASILLPACGWVGSMGVYSPVTGAPGGSGGVKTLTIGAYEDGRLKMLRGAMGTAVFRMTSGKMVLIEFTFRGVWVPPVDAALLAPTYPTLAPLRMIDAGLTIGSWTPVVAEMTLDLGNELQLREDANDTVAGYRSAYIADRACKMTIDPEASLVADEDVYGNWLANSEGAMALSLGAAGNGVSVAAPKAQITNIQPADRNKLQVDQIEYQLNRSAAGGDDELVFTML